MLSCLHAFENNGEILYFHSLSPRHDSSTEPKITWRNLFSDTRYDKLWYTLIIIYYFMSWRWTRIDGRCYPSKRPGTRTHDFHCWPGGVRNLCDLNKHRPSARARFPKSLRKAILGLRSTFDAHVKPSRDGWDAHFGFFRRFRYYNLQQLALPLHVFL